MFIYCVSSSGSWAKLSCSPGWFEALHRLHHRSGHRHARGTCFADRRWRLAPFSSRLSCSACVSAPYTDWGSVLPRWSPRREGAEVVHLQHRHGQLPRGGHHPELWLGWGGQVRFDPCYFISVACLQQKKKTRLNWLKTKFCCSDTIKTVAVFNSAVLDVGLVLATCTGYQHSRQKTTRKLDFLLRLVAEQLVQLKTASQK